MRWLTAFCPHRTDAAVAQHTIAFCREDIGGIQRGREPRWKGVGVPGGPRQAHELQSQLAHQSHEGHLHEGKALSTYVMYHHSIVDFVIKGVLHMF